MAYNPRDTLEGLEKMFEQGKVSRSRYEKAKAYHLEAIAREERRAAGLPPTAGDRRDSRRNVILGIVGAGLVVLTLGWCSSLGDGAAGELYESTAELACERSVRDQLGGGSFEPGANWEITDGWAVHGMVTHAGQRVGYSCDVTGTDGSPRVANVQIG